MISTFSQMNPVVINTADMDALVEVLLNFHSEDMNSWCRRNFVFYKQTNEQYSSTIQMFSKKQNTRSSMQQVPADAGAYCQLDR